MADQHALRLSVVVPAHNEEGHIAGTLTELAEALRTKSIPFEIIAVDDNSRDTTAKTIDDLTASFPEICPVRNSPPAGLGRAVRCGLRHITGDVVAIVMADASDAPGDVVACYRLIEEGYDCVFGSRFIRGSRVDHYPRIKLALNRMANQLLRVLFLTRHNDLTNAFKVYRRHVIDSIQPFRAAHFDITIELSLSALIRDYSIATLPIQWSGRTWGHSNLRIRSMARRYGCTVIRLWFERLLIKDDLIADRVPSNKE